MNDDLFDGWNDDWSMWITLSRVPQEQRDRLGEMAVSEEYASSGLIEFWSLSDAEAAVKRFGKEISEAEEVTVLINSPGGDRFRAAVDVSDYRTGFEAGMAAYHKAFEFRIRQ